LIGQFRTVGFFACGAVGLWPGISVRADDTLGTSQVLQTAVVEASAIPGAEIDADKVPGNVQSLSAGDVSRAGSASLTQAMDAKLGSININDNLNDPFQPDMLYRGFEASPVLGTPQGLAVYQNGVRINEAFGDTVNWDLLPSIAISRVDLVSSSPVYGLNALGGGVSLTMKDGFNYHGSDLEISGGSFGNHAAALQYGVNSDTFGFYIAGNALENTGWRPYSDDSLRQLYAVLSAHSDRATLDLSYTRGDNQMDGQGASPLQEQAVNRALVFTGPQTNINRLNFLTLDATLKLTDTWSVQGVMYYRQYQQVISNGNTTDYTACTTTANTGSLCQSDGITPVADSTGAPLPDISNGGALYIGENDFETINAYGRGAALQTTASAAILGLKNELAAGATIDYAELNFFSGTQIGLINSQLFVEPSNLIVNTPEDSPFGADPVSLKGLNRNFGAYFTDTLNVSKAFSVTGSGRYNSASVDMLDLRGTALNGDNRFSHFNPAIGGTYQLLPGITAYADYAQNTRTPTASEIECSNPLTPCLLPSNLAGDPPLLRQVVAHTFELGLRSKIPAETASAGTTSWNLSAFRTNLDDDIYGIATSVSTGFYQNIGATRRQGFEAGIDYQSLVCSGYLNYSYVAATFQSALTLPSPSNPDQDANGNIQVEPGDRLPGIPQHRLKAGFDYKLSSDWNVGATIKFVSDEYYYGDESNQNSPLSSYQVVGLHTSYTVSKSFQVFGSIENLLNAKYATYGIYSDPTGTAAPGVPVAGVANGVGVDNRFSSPAYPFAVFGGVRLAL
jgi:iron complex outermembrane recepter protein